MVTAEARIATERPSRKRWSSLGNVCPLKIAEFDISSSKSLTSSRSNP